MLEKLKSGLCQYARFACHGFCPIAILIAGAFFAASLAPSMLPRPTNLQGVLSGLAAAVGFWTGMGVQRLVEYLVPNATSLRRNRPFLFVATALAGLSMGVSLYFANSWNEDLGRFLSIETDAARFAPVVIAVSVPLLALLLTLGASVTALIGGAARVLGRFVPARVAGVLGFVLSIYLVATLVSGTLGGFAIESVDAVFLELDQRIDPEVPAPTDPLVTGSAASRIRWRDLGRQGRAFVGGAAGLDVIAAFSPSGMKRPVRTYVGLGSAETPGERALLALEEMKRQGAFDRSAIVLVTPTGTGWVDDAAVDTLEILHGGDIAVVAQQYSYLTSYASILLEPGYSVETAAALFETVHSYWRELPEATRPRLYLHGLSLGSQGSEQSMRIYRLVSDPIHGALWSGPPNANTYRTWFTRNRNTDSPEWLPVYGDGSLVRFANQDTAHLRNHEAWGPVRLVYLQYASDPVSFLSPRMLFRKPDWLKGERGPDVSPNLRWVPVITALQVAFDMASATAHGTGIGHSYAAEDYIDAWISVTEPEGWDAERIERLKATFRK